MIKITKVLDDYYLCNSCMASVKNDNARIFTVSIGQNPSFTTSINLCLKCITELRLKISSSL